jgi:DNA-directed RNA polymerase I, II, and III subunit RPABC1
MIDEYTYLYNAWKTSQEMIEDRGFKLDENYKRLSDNDFKFLVHEKKIDLFASHINENTGKEQGIYVKFITTLRIKPTLIKNYIDEIREQITIDNLDIIIVLKIEPNNTIYKLEKEKSVQIMHCKELQINKTKHRLVPKHQKISDEDANEIIKKYSLISKTQLPIILKDKDPICRYYNFKAGDIIKITNNAVSQNIGYEYYRCVR